MNQLSKRTKWLINVWDLFFVPIGENEYMLTTAHDPKVGLFSETVAQFDTDTGEFKATSVASELASEVADNDFPLEEANREMLELINSIAKDLGIVKKKNPKQNPLRIGDLFTYEEIAKAEQLNDIDEIEKQIVKPVMKRYKSEIDPRYGAKYIAHFLLAAIQAENKKSNPKNSQDDDDIELDLLTGTSSQTISLLEGGAAEGMSPEDFDEAQLKIGTIHELEHTNSKEVAQRIAMDHLVEDPEYYIKKRMISKHNPAAVIKTGKDRNIWNYHKRQVAKDLGVEIEDLHEEDWAAVMHRYLLAKDKYKNKSLPKKYNPDYPNEGGPDMFEEMP
jgi:hypothetical protein